MKLCSANKADGTPCQARAMAGGTCLFHSPEHSERMQKARQNGGKSRSKPAATLPDDVPDLPLQNVADVRVALAMTFNQCRKGQLDCKIANALTYIAATLVRTIEGSDHEHRLAELEAAAKRASA